MLTAEEIDRYNTDGFIVIPDAISAAEINAMRAAVAVWVEESRGVTTHTDIYDLEPGHTAEQPRIRRIKTPDLWHPAFAAMVKHPNIISALRSLWGPNIRYDISKLNLKSASFGSSLEWHQDWAFYPHTNDDLAVVGIMLDDIDEENGAMMVIPGSHKGPIYDHSSKGVFVGGIDPTGTDIDFSAAQYCSGKAGSISIHHVRMLHGGAANRSNRDRRFFLMQYRAGDAWPLTQTMDWDTWVSTLVSGEETWTPRMKSLPIRLPFPSPQHEGSIYENQRDLEHRFFVDESSS